MISIATHLVPLMLSKSDMPKLTFSKASPLMCLKSKHLEIWKVGQNSVHKFEPEWYFVDMKNCNLYQLEIHSSDYGYN